MRNDAGMLLQSKGLFLKQSLPGQTDKSVCPATILLEQLT